MVNTLEELRIPHSSGEMLSLPYEGGTSTWCTPAKTGNACTMGTVVVNSLLNMEYCIVRIVLKIEVRIQKKELTKRA